MGAIVPNAPKAGWIRGGQRVVEDVGVAVPGLGEGGGGGGEASGVGGGPAAEGARVMAEEGVVEAGFGVALFVTLRVISLF
ncbi:MAG TPA: hypothetical protein VFA68_12145 [Terriglobales bacterium]|nr:hypothetical protein [Terriglobales bacterium]